MISNIIHRELTEAEKFLLAISCTLFVALSVGSLLFFGLETALLMFFTTSSICFIVSVCAFGSMIEEIEANIKKESFDFDKFIDRL